ncbi:MAG: hypothetical protein HPY53_03895 [Brevinematales bacterium]|nr:hypothetical protein [Brevinematales bacterium]
MLLQILLWGLVIGVIHFVAVGILYMNPFTAKLYRDAGEHPALRKWPKQGEYILKMALGTQAEVYILTAGYIYLRSLFAEPTGWTTALILAAIFSAVRVYPRFWNMLIQSTYPRKLLAVEFVNGVVGTFIIVLGLKLLPIQ